jgi:hypothetical protein
MRVSYGSIRVYVCVERYRGVFSFEGMSEGKARVKY